MRLLFPVMMALAASASAQPAIVTPPSAHRPSLLQTSDCPNPSSQFARDGSVWRQKPVKPQKLTELPSAEAYAAVYRLDERGCMVPVKFREIRR
jgi:hypothetical protein